MKTFRPLLFLLSLATPLILAQAGPNPLEAELFPPDFLAAQREALGLEPAQIEAMQSLVQAQQEKIEGTRSELEAQSAAIREAFKDPHPDPAQIEAKVRAFLTQEADAKALQVRLLLELRGKLTPEQIEKARALRQKGASGDPHGGMAERMHQKFEQLKAAVQEQASAGGPPPEIIAEAQEIERLGRSGQPQEAEQRLDALLAKVRGQKAK